MNLLDLITGAAGGGAVSELGQRFGLNETQTQSAIGALLPALTGAISQNASSPSGLAGLLGALASGDHARYVDNPSSLLSPETVQEGNGILGHLLGDKQVSRQVASNAAQQTGISSDVLKQMLPLVATLVMGGLSKQTAQGTSAAALQGGGGMFGAISSLLDRDGDGSPLNDVLGMAARFLGNR